MKTFILLTVLAVTSFNAFADEPQVGQQESSHCTEISGNTLEEAAPSNPTAPQETGSNG